MPYPVPNATHFVELLQNVNASYTNNLFGMFILFAVFMIAFISLKNYPAETGFTTSAFLTTLAAIFLSIMELIAPEMVLIMTIITALSTLLLFRRGS